MKRQFVWAMTIAGAVLAAACDGGQNAAGLSPTAASASSSQASANSGQGLTAAQSAALTATCGSFGSGDRVTTPGAPQPGTPPSGSTVVTGPGGLGPVGPDGTVTTPGAPPPGAATGSQLAIGGALDNLAGACPVLTFTIGGKTTRTNDTTSFGNGSCASLKNSDSVGAVGTAQADGSIVASCVAGI